MKKRSRRVKVGPRRVTAVKKDKNKTREGTLEQEYIGIFQPYPLPHQGLLTENDSLEQPSPMKDYPSTATPGVGISIGFQLKA